MWFVFIRGGLTGDHAQRDSFDLDGITDLRRWTEMLVESMGASRAGMCGVSE